MTYPNQALLERYGTQGFYAQNLEKKAELPAMLQMLGPLGTAAMLNAQAQHEARQREEAAIMNAMLRELAAKKQEGVVGGLSGKQQAMSASGRAAQGLNEMAQYQAMMSLMNKRASAGPRSQAFMDELEKMAEEDKEAFLGAGLKALGKGLGSLGRRVAGTPMQQAVGRSSNMAANIGNKMRGMGVSMQQAGNKVQGLKMPGAARAAAPGAASLPATAGAAQQAVRGPSMMQNVKKAITPGWKTKAGLTAAGLGTAYVGYKGLQAAKDYMMQPTYMSSSWGGQGMLPGRVNQFGYTNPY